MKISDEAVEAAHKAWREQDALDSSIFEYNLRAALEAAAPYIAADAWDEGHNHCFRVEDPTRNDRNPYRSDA